MKNTYDRGFTLVELIVTLGVFGIIIIAGTNFLIQTIRNSNRSVISGEVRQNANILMQDIVWQARKAYCIYYESPTLLSPYSNNALLRLSDDPNGAKCAVGNIVEYYQDQKGIVTKAATDSAGVQLSFGVLTSSTAVILNCSSGGSACGLSDASSCLAGLVVTSNGSQISSPVVNGSQVTVAIQAQQIPGLIKSENCASVSLLNTVTPRVK